MYGTIRKNYGARIASDVSENVVERSYEEKKDKRKEKKKEIDDLQQTRYMRVDYDTTTKRTVERHEAPSGKHFKNEFPIASVILTIVFAMMAMVFAFGFGTM